MRMTPLLFGLLIVFTAGSCLALEFEETPIQTQMWTAVASPAALTASASTARIGLLAGYDEFGNVNPNDKRKSPWRAGLYSALLPGAGEYYAGSKRRAKYFFAVEALSWISYISFKSYSNWREDDFINYARDHAGAELEGKGKEFQDWVGFYSDIDQFNTLGRVSDRDRPFLVDNTENHWRWNTVGERSAYRELKNSSREADRRADFVIGVMVITRLVSIIDAVHVARHSGSLFGDAGDLEPRRLAYKLDVDPFGSTWQVGMTVSAKF